MTRVLSAVALLACSPGAAWTSETDSPAATTLQEEVVVTANRVEQKPGDVAGNVTIFTREEIARSAARTLDDFLRRVPGFSLFRRSSSLVAHPTSQGVSLRGISPSGVSRALVLVDGVPANDSFGGWVSWSRIPLERVERIEILRGGGSNLWGSAALGGVINIVTRGVAENEMVITANAGTGSDVELDLFGGRSSGRVGWSLEGNYFHTDGYEIVREDQRGAIDIEAFSEHLHLHPALRYVVSPRGLLTVQADYFAEDRGNGTPFTHNGIRAARFDATAEFTTKRGSDWRITLFTNDQTFDSTFSSQATDRSSETPALDQFAVDSTDVGVSTQWTRRVAGKHLLTAGADLRWIDGETNENFLWDGSAFLRRRQAGGEQQLAGIFLQDLMTGSSGLQLEISGRIDYWKNTDGFRQETVQADGMVLRADSFRTRDASTLSPKIAVLYRPADHLTLRGSLYRSFRAPTINELYRPFRVRNDITEANAGLDPETLTGVEIGFDYRSGRRLHGRLTTFWNRVEDAIANITIAEALTAGVIAPCGFVPAGGACRQRQNLGETRIIGVEAEAGVRPNDLWDISLGYLYSDGEIIDAPTRPDLEGRRIAQVPKHQLSLALTFDDPRTFGARVQVRYLGDQFEDDRNTRELGDYTVVDLSFWKSFDSGLNFFVGVENLLDERYTVGKSGDGLTTIGAPRRIHAGVRVGLGRPSSRID